MKFLNKKVVLNVVILLIVFAGGLYIGEHRTEWWQDIRYGSPSQNNKLPASLDYSGVEELYSKLKQRYDGELDQDKLVDGLKAGLVKAAGDPFTEYMNTEEAKSFRQSLNGSFEGIGAELGKKDNSIVIISPLDGFPAKKAGLKSQDVITSINGESTLDTSITDAVKKIRGEKGTKVKLGILRDGKQLEFEITRSTITVPSVKYKMLENKIGLIEISRFGDDTTNLATKAANNLKNKGAQSIILDLRGNPGGLLDSAVEVSSLWVPKGNKVLEEKRGGQTVKTFYALGGDVLRGIPTVVLIDGGSASASEITAGALRDNKTATLIGEKSFGKGSVQEVVDLQKGGILKVTIARWFTPGGRNIDKQGIEPDQIVKFTEKDVKSLKDPQLSAAKQYLINHR
jgi:carboxyl-terminal processing protease